ncbi:MAG: septum site-determining protein Ssd [Candidatus Nanopelagicales bacterium]
MTVAFMNTTTLLASADPILIEHVRSLAAAGGMQIDVLSEPQQIREEWNERSCVLVGADLCDHLVGVPKRRDLAVLLWQFTVQEAIPARLWQAAVALGAEHVVALPEGDHWLADRLTQVQPGEPSTGRLLGIAGACGGAGASSLAVGLAAALVDSGKHVLLIDGDMSGGGIDLLLGAEASPGARWPALAQTSGRVSEQTLLPSLPTPHGIALVSAARAELTAPTLEAWKAVLGFGLRGFDAVIVDLTRERAASFGQWVPDGSHASLWCVTPNRIRAIAAAAVVLEQLEDVWPRVEVITRQADRSIAVGDVRRALGKEPLGCLPEDPGVVIAGEQGLLAQGAYAKACASLARSWWQS